MANGAIVGNVETFWESERGGGYEDLEFAKLDAYQEWTVRVGYESDNGWNVMAYVENVTDEVTYAGSQVNGELTPNWLVGPNKPRTAGVRFGYSFD